jgi:prefoldin subunit 5
MSHSVDTLAFDIQNMDARLTDLEEKIDKIDVKLTQVIEAIMGNSLTKQGGFINDIDILKVRIEELEKKQLNYENFKNKISWTVGLVVGTLMFIQYLINIYTNIKK